MDADAIRARIRDILAQQAQGGAAPKKRKPSAHALAVKAVMKKHPKWTLGEASHYVAAHGLAKKKK